MTHNGSLFGIAGLVFGAAAGFAISLWLPDTYISHATLRVVTKWEGAALWALEAVQDVRARHTLLQIIETEGLYKSELENWPLEDVIGTMLMRDIRFDRIALPGGSLQLRISFHYRDGRAAQRTTQALMDRFESFRLNNRAAFEPIILEVLQPPRAASPLEAATSWIGFEQTYTGIFLIRAPTAPQTADTGALKRLVLDRQTLLSSVANDLPSPNESPDDMLRKMRSAIRVAPGESNDELQIFYRDRSPQDAQRRLTNLLSNIIVTRIRKPGWPPFTLLGPPSLPRPHYQRTPVMATILGAVFGAMLAITLSVDP